jgi:hypothetical protein
MSHHMYLLSVDEKHDVHVDKDFGVIQPYWLASIGCDLTKDDPQEQYSRTTCPRSNGAPSSVAFQGSATALIR